MLIAHLSDPHIGGRADAVARFERVVHHLGTAQPQPDVVIITGDVADHGTPDEYALAQKILTPIATPTLIGPGNHDVRPNFAAAFAPGEPGGTGRDGPVNGAIDISGYRFLMLDSLVPAPPGERNDHGTLAPETLAWLDQQLAAGMPTLVCLHHPPLGIGVEWLDAIKLTNGSDLAAVLLRHHNIVAVLAGHAHTMCATTFAGRPLLIGGGITSTFCLDQEGGAAPEIDVAPTMAWHMVSEDNSIVTHWRSL